MSRPPCGAGGLGPERCDAYDLTKRVAEVYLEGERNAVILASAADCWDREGYRCPRV